MLSLFFCIPHTPKRPRRNHRSSSSDLGKEYGRPVVHGNFPHGRPPRILPQGQTSRETAKAQHRTNAELRATRLPGLRRQTQRDGLRETERKKAKTSEGPALSWERASDIHFRIRKITLPCLHSTTASRRPTPTILTLRLDSCDDSPAPFLWLGFRSRRQADAPCRTVSFVASLLHLFLAIQPSELTESPSDSTRPLFSLGIGICLQGRTALFTT